MEYNGVKSVVFMKCRKYLFWRSSFHTMDEFRLPTVIQNEVLFYQAPTCAPNWKAWGCLFQNRCYLDDGDTQQRQILPHFSTGACIIIYGHHKR